MASHAKPRGPILVVGATGSTGFRAIQGLLDLGFRPNQIRLLTRNARSSRSNALRSLGFSLVEADLEDPSSLKASKVTKDCVGCYVHSTSSDTPELDTGEVERARNLAFAILQEKNKIRNLVYNSAAAHENHGVGRIQQKHDVEDVFKETVTAFNKGTKGSRTMAFTSLRANIFMEELWKHYTRPTILGGTYPLPVPSSRKIYLVSVRDMGRLAGTVFKEKSVFDPIRIINVAGDYLSANEIAEAFARVQGSPCHHHNPRLMTLKSYFYFPELYEQIMFLQTFSVVTDVNDLHERFPDTMTSFEQFLRETHWEDADRTFAEIGRAHV